MSAAFRHKDHKGFHKGHEDAEAAREKEPMPGHSLQRAALVVAACLLALAVRADPVPSLWDPDLRLDKPDLGALKAIRFLTADD